MDEKFI